MVGPDSGENEYWSNSDSLSTKAGYKNKYAPKMYILVVYLVILKVLKN